MAKVQLDGTWALVTGASSGIGRELSCRLAELGCNLVLTARNGERLKALSGELESKYGCATRVIQADLATAAGTAQLLAEVDESGVQIEHLVNNAGFGGAGPFVELSPEVLEGQLQLNCVALTTLTRHFLPRLIAKGRGGVLQVASVAGFMPVPYMAVYAATKAYVLSLNSALREELRGTGVHCTALCPGPVETAFQARAGYQLGGVESGSMLSARVVAEAAVKGYLARKSVVAPGFGARSMAWIASHLAPHRVAAISGAVMRKAGRDKPATSSPVAGA